MVAEKNREIGGMTMAREVEEKEADLHIQRIEGTVAGWPNGGEAEGFRCLRLRQTQC